MILHWLGVPLRTMTTQVMWAVGGCSTAVASLTSAPTNTRSPYVYASMSSTSRSDTLSRANAGQLSAMREFIDHTLSCSKGQFTKENRCLRHVSWTDDTQQKRRPMLLDLFVF